MNSNRLRTQQKFEGFFGGITSEEWQSLKKRNILDYDLTAQNIADLNESLALDAKDLYFKGLLSITEAIFNIDKGLYSWATVKLYYSIFYLLRCSLACKNIAIIRHMRDLYYVTVNQGESIKRATANQDHKAVIGLFQLLFKESDLLQSNTIEDINPYLWIMERREEVNYKDREFHEPSPPDFFYEINCLSTTDGIGSVLHRLVDDEFLLCFQEEYATLAIPLKRLILTKKDLLESGIDIGLSNEKREKIESMLPFFDNKLFEAFF